MRRTQVWGGVGLLATGLVAGMWLGAPVTSAQVPLASRIAIVDIQRVMARSVVGVAIREQLEKEKAVMQKQIDGQRVEVEKLQQEMEKKGQLLSADARREKQEMLERKVRDIRRLMDDLQKELLKREETLVGKALQDVGGLVQKLGKEKGYAMIFQRSGGVVYAAPEADLTDEVVRVYDDETKKAKK